MTATTKPATAVEFRSREAEVFLGGLDKPDAVQADVLRSLIVAPNVECEFGRAHGFADLGVALVADHGPSMSRGAAA